MTVSYDKQEQVNKVQENLIANETLVAVYDLTGIGTGFVGITDKRLIIQDKSFSGKKVALTSIPYGHITSVSFISTEKGLTTSFFSTSSLGINVGVNTYECDFRGLDKAKYVHDYIVYQLTK